MTDPDPEVVLPPIPMAVPVEVPDDQPLVETADAPVVVEPPTPPPVLGGEDI